MQLRDGDNVGSYRIIGKIGQGGMGTVYRAVHVLLQRPAAIKLLNEDARAHRASAERFLIEARVASAIRHPGIVEVYDFAYTDAGRSYIAMELLEGRTLARRIADGGPIDVAEALLIARRIAAALAVAHERGIVHRDLKPENIFLVADPEGGAIPGAKILDFGIAKVSGSNGTLTQGSILGTPAYMSPEQCLGAETCDDRTDVYALGCVMFEMVAGRPPFRTTSSWEMLGAHLHQPVPRVEELARVSPPVAELIARMLAKTAAHRPSAAEIRRALDACIAMPMTDAGCGARHRRHTAPTRPMRLAVEAITSRSPGRS